MGSKRTIHQNYKVSVHEAGHATTALAVNIGVVSVDIQANSGREGLTVYDESDILFNASDFDLLTTAVGGTLAERRWYRDDRKIDGENRTATDSDQVNRLLSRYRKSDRDVMLTDAEKRADKALRYNSHIFDRFLDELLTSKQINQSTINRILNHQKLWKV